MTARSKHRGHPMYYDGTDWRYEDDDSLVCNTWQERPCGYCGEWPTSPDGHDPCIANLPGVMNACCGHGENSKAYIQFNDGYVVSGSAAIYAFFELLGS